MGNLEAKTPCVMTMMVPIALKIVLKKGKDLHYTGQGRCNEFKFSGSKSGKHKHGTTGTTTNAAPAGASLGRVPWNLWIFG